MKKLSFIICLCLLLLTGCKDDRLVCTSIEDTEEFKLESKYIFTFSKDKVKKATMKSTGTLLGELNNEEIIGEYRNSAQSSANKYNETEGIKAQVSNSKNKVTLTVDIIVASLTDEDKEKYGVNSNREELKEVFEENGYTCK